MKKQLLLRFFSATVLVYGFIIASGQNYTFAFTPAIGNYTDCGSGSIETVGINYSSCNYNDGTSNYSLGHIKSRVTSFNSSTGEITIEVKKCNGYFVNGNSFKIFLGFGFNLDLECFYFTINNSTTSSVECTTTIPSSWYSNGYEYIFIFLVTSDLAYRQYGGCITVECSQNSGGGGNCYCDAHTTLTAPSGSFSDGSGSNEYADYSDCEWLIMPPGATSITLTFSQFETESCCDFVDVYDGASTSSPHIGHFSGQSIPSSVTSSSGTMLVRFTSDYSDSEDG